ncbi:hypothetical protein [Undibacterium curvum]|uniref:hypothetical protein n=1 Tax=Undibacterium curvum TaxID=2762294 RepID=UPI003D1471E5
MNIWTQDEEAENLRNRFTNVNRAEFARANGISGGQSLIYQHITGRRPIGKDAAIAYAKGFSVSLEEISPRIALEISEAAQTSLFSKDYIRQSSGTVEEQRAQYYPTDIQSVIDMMMSTDTEGRTRIKLAVSDVLYEYNKKRETSRPQIGNLPSYIVERIANISDPDLVPALEGVLNAFPIQAQKQRIK